MDLMNQMREKSQSQALVRSMDEEEWRKQKQRLDEWNDQERIKNEKRIRRMEKRREMLLKQMQESPNPIPKKQTDTINLDPVSNP